jgi:hypothetical protein
VATKIVKFKPGPYCQFSVQSTQLQLLDRVLDLEPASVHTAATRHPVRGVGSHRCGQPLSRASPPDNSRTTMPLLSEGNIGTHHVNVFTGAESRRKSTPCRCAAGCSMCKRGAMHARGFGELRSCWSVETTSRLAHHAASASCSCAVQVSCQCVGVPARALRLRPRSQERGDPSPAQCSC